LLTKAPGIFLAAAVLALALAAGSAASAADSVAQGRDLYNTLCARCHGMNLTHPQPPAPDLHNYPKSRHADFVAMVENGKGEMPPWKGMLSPQQIDQIWSYVKSGRH
jgi:mono/diheme cytochrome c family protein